MAREKRLVDFCGFQFNGVHSSELGLTRVSDGSRYNENLGGNFSDKTVQVPGGDGMLYWESFYSNRNWNINVAFDDLTEKEFRRLKQVFNAKARGELIFDESPYKAYSVKVQSPPQFKYICFDANKRTQLESKSTKVTIKIDNNTEGVKIKKGNTNDYYYVCIETETGKNTSEYKQLCAQDGQNSTRLKINKGYFTFGTTEDELRVPHYENVYTVQDIESIKINNGNGWVEWDQKQFDKAYGYKVYKNYPHWEYQDFIKSEKSDGTIEAFNFEIVFTATKVSLGPVDYYNRVYKGEGVIQFIAYYPYATSVYKYLKSYQHINEQSEIDVKYKYKWPYPNINEWKDAADLVIEKGKVYDQSCSYENRQIDEHGNPYYIIDLYNAGDIETDWAMFFRLIPIAKSTAHKDDIPKISLCVPKSIQLLDASGRHILGELKFNRIDTFSGKADEVPDQLISINSRTNMIEGFSSVPLSTLPAAPITPAKIPGKFAKENIVIEAPTITAAKTVADAVTVVGGNDMYASCFPKGEFSLTQGKNMANGLVQYWNLGSSSQTYSIAIPDLSSSNPNTATRSTNTSFDFTQLNISRDSLSIATNVVNNTGRITSADFVAASNALTLIPEDKPQSEWTEYEKSLVDWMANVMLVLAGAQQGAEAVATGRLYNKYLKAGEFFKIPVGESKLKVIMYQDSSSVTDFDSDSYEESLGFETLEYNYLYI